MFDALTGWYCIGCAWRALHALAHGDVPGAFSMNPLAISMLAISPLLAAWKLGWQPKWLRPSIVVLAEPKFWLVLLPLYWIARNLPWFPFTLLAPGWELFLLLREKVPGGADEGMDCQVVLKPFFRTVK